MLLSFIIPLSLAEPQNYKYFVFMWLGFLPFAFPLYFSKKYIMLLFIVLMVEQLFASSISGFSFKGLNRGDFLSGSAALTHTLPAIFGFLLYPLYKEKKYKLTSLCLLMIPLAGKRSVIIAAVFGIGAQILGNFLTKNKHKGKGNVRWKKVFYISMIYILGLTVSMYIPYIYEIISAHYGLNINILSSGRYTGQRLAFGSIYNADFISLFFGQGLGQGDRYSNIGWNAPVILHNEYLRVLVDFGILNGFLFLFCFFRLVSSGKNGLYLIGVCIVLWQTENPLIGVLFGCLYFILSSSDSGPLKSADASKLYDPQFRNSLS